MRHISISRQLFRAYALLFLVLYAVCIATAAAYMFNTIDSSIIETQKHMTDTISKAISDYFDDMNAFSLDLMNSKEFKQAVIAELPNALDKPEKQVQLLKTAYICAYKMIEKDYHVGVATNSGCYFWFGSRPVLGKISGPVSTYDDYAGYGKPVLKVLEENAYLKDIAAEGKPAGGEPMLVLARSVNISNLFTKPQAILEVQVRRRAFEDFVRSLAGSQSRGQLRISVFTQDGSTLCGDVDHGAALKAVDAENSTGWISASGDMLRTVPAFGGSVLICFQIPAHIFYQRITTFVIGAAAFSVFLLLLLLVATYHLSKGITRPISELSRQLEKISLEEHVQLERIDTRILELDVMAQTVCKMNEQLAASMDEVVMAKTAELQSRLMALQSQMEPHFLYNTLAVIRALNEQGKTSQASSLCIGLAQMLRYTSAKQEGGVEMEKELEFLQSYAGIMLQRFPHAAVRVQMPPEILHCRVPKMILQPLCENSFKYADRSKLEIDVAGSIDEHGWTVRVSDNGPGFSKESIKTIMERCKTLYEDSKTLSASVNGMSLVNIYARLALFYHGDFVFELTEAGGIKLGGRVYDAQ